MIVPQELNDCHELTQTTSGSVGRNEALRYFFRVPAGTPTLSVDFSGPSETPGSGQARFLRFHPFGVGIDSNSSLAFYSPPVIGGPACNARIRSQTNPATGVWEVTVEARRTSDVPFTPFTLSVSILGASVTPNPDTNASATIGVPVNRSYTITNLLGPFTGRATGSTLASALRARPTIANLEQQNRDVEVTPGTTSLRATIGNLLRRRRRPRPDRVQMHPGRAWSLARTPTATRRSRSPSPTQRLDRGRCASSASRYRTAQRKYDYIAVFTNTAFGSVSVTDADAFRPAGSAWTVPGSVTANAAPAGGRVLLGSVQVRTNLNVLVGSGDVIVDAVSGP